MYFNALRLFSLLLSRSHAEASLHTIENRRVSYISHHQRIAMQNTNPDPEGLVEQIPTIDLSDVVDDSDHCDDNEDDSPELKRARTGWDKSDDCDGILEDDVDDYPCCVLPMNDFHPDSHLGPGDVHECLDFLPAMLTDMDDNHVARSVGVSFKDQAIKCLARGSECRTGCSGIGNPETAAEWINDEVKENVPPSVTYHGIQFTSAEDVDTDCRFMLSFHPCQRSGESCLYGNILDQDRLPADDLDKFTRILATKNKENIAKGKTGF